MVPVLLQFGGSPATSVPFSSREPWFRITGVPAPHEQSPLGRSLSVTLVRLTEKGKSLENDFMNISKDLISRVYDGFSDLEKEILVKLLARIKDNL